MQGVINFLLKYYIYFLFGLVLFVLGLIGYLVDDYRMRKYAKDKIVKKAKITDVPDVNSSKAEEVMENIDLSKMKDKTISSLQKSGGNPSGDNTQSTAAGGLAESQIAQAVAPVAPASNDVTQNTP